MLTHLKNLDVVGHYQLAQKLGGISKNMFSTIGRSWVPYFMKKAELNTKKSKNEIVDRYYEIIMVYNYFSLMICAFSEELIKLLTTEAFYPSMYILPLFVTYIFITHVVGALSKPQITYAEKLEYTLPSPIVALIINIIANILLIPIYGAMGAIIATLLSGIVSSVILFHFGQRAYLLPINNIIIAKQFLIYATYLTIVYYSMFLDLPLFNKLLIKCILLISYFYLSIKINLLKRERVTLIYKKVRELIV